MSDLETRIVGLEAMLVDAQAEIAELRAALRPFAEYRAWARQHEWPINIASDPGTPVWGSEGDEDRPGVAVYVRDFDRAAELVGRPS